MQVRDIMNHSFQSISRTATLRTAAMQMRDMDIGMLPVEQDGEVIGTITDRDITVRAIANGADPGHTPVGDVMSNEIYTCVDSDDVEQAANIMERHQIRRLMVQDEHGKFTGILALADLARHRGTEQLSVEILEEVSQPASL